MNFDRNTVIGIIFLGLLFLGYFYFNNQQQQAYLQEKKRQDSIRLATQPRPVPPAIQDSLKGPDSVQLSTPGSFQQGIPAQEATQVVENNLAVFTFTNKGGQLRSVELKQFLAPDSSNVKMGASDFDQFSYTIIPSPNTTSEISTLVFNGGEVQKNADGSSVVSYNLTEGEKAIVHRFTIRPDSYMIDFDIIINGVPQLFSNNNMNIRWQHKATRLQKDLSYERQQSQVSYKVDDDYDYTSATSSSREEFSKPVNWVGVKQQFFNATLIAKNKFSSGMVEWTAPASTDQDIVVQATAHLKYTLPATAQAEVPLQLYYGPTDYKTLKRYGNDLEDMVNLGSGIFAFVKYINRWIILPVFDFLRTLTSNYGIVILLLTLFIRLLISPLTYSSYLSGAKMKALRPEIEQLKLKYGNDQQQISMEQMKLFREAGVNPLGGCIPGLLQIPIFFALYSFFNANVALRGQNFLWADDLSQYDSIIDFGFNIPLYGDHVSLFTITAVITSFMISIYSLSMTPDQNNPVLKYMPYVFPVILLFVFNSMPSGLTWYYTVSNIITLILQFIIQNYIINHDKILANIEANRKKPKTKSKWQERIEQMQEQQKKMQEMQKKNKS